MAEKKLSEIRTFVQELKPMNLSQAAVSNEPDLPCVNLADGASRALLSAPPAATGAIASPRVAGAIASDARVRYPRHIPVPLFDRVSYTRLNSFSPLPTMQLILDSD